MKCVATEGLPLIYCSNRWARVESIVTKKKRERSVRQILIFSPIMPYLDIHQKSVISESEGEKIYHITSQDATRPPTSHTHCYCLLKVQFSLPLFYRMLFKQSLIFLFFPSTHSAFLTKIDIH